MSAGTLVPGFIRLDYHSQYAPHTMTLPTKEPAFATIGDVPTYTAWDGTTVTALTMMAALISATTAFYSTNITIDSWTAFKQTDHIVGTEHVLDPAQPIYYRSVGTACVGVTTGWEAATQRTYTMRTSGFGLAKLVFLDSATDNDFSDHTSLGALEAAIITAYTNNAHAFRGRDGFQPLVFHELSITLNERLRKSYHLD